MTMICSSVPTSRSRTMAKAVRLTMMTSVNVPITPGTKNQRPLRSSIVPGPLLDRHMDLALAFDAVRALQRSVT